jgi:mono/diheme cytochrome c family protein
VTGRPRALALVLAALSTVGCARGCASSRPPIHLNPNMDDTPRYEAQEASAFFHDGKVMRPPVPGTVARGRLVEEPAVVTGKDESGAFLATMPVEGTEAQLERGGARFEIYCQPCHDRRGDGRGILFHRAGVPTPSFHDERIRALGDGELFDVITNGKGLMPAYGYPIPPEDRWAIVSWVRHLQQERASADVADGSVR